MDAAISKRIQRADWQQTSSTVGSLQRFGQKPFAFRRKRQQLHAAIDATFNNH
jgi:hypothetical protein